MKNTNTKDPLIVETKVTARAVETAQASAQKDLAAEDRPIEEFLVAHKDLAAHKDLTEEELEADPLYIALLNDDIIRRSEK